jgi:hypothetical protein
MPEERIKGEVELRIVLMAFRYIFHPEIMSRLKNIFQLFRELPDKATFNEYLEMLLIYLGSNIKNVKFDQLQESVNDVIKEGGALMSTIFEEVLEKGKEIGVKEGEEIGLKKGEEKNKITKDCCPAGKRRQFFLTSIFSRFFSTVFFLAFFSVPLQKIIYQHVIQSFNFLFLLPKSTVKICLS